jgi:hypothetical protein
MTPSVSVAQPNERPHSTMMAWRVHEFGPPEVLKLERISRPDSARSASRLWVDVLETQTRASEFLSSSK